MTTMANDADGTQESDSPGTDPESRLLASKTPEDSAFPEVLYHYTNQAGLLGILQSKVLFATKVQYFNDSAEFHLSLDLAAAIIRDRAGTVLSAESAVALEKDIDRIRHANIFAISLSEESDVLSQWRAYGAPGTSFAIGVHVTVIERIALSIGWALDKCIYDPLEHRQVVGAAISECLDQEGDSGTVLRDLLMAIAPINKHISFEEEKEWRIVSPPLPEEFEFDFRVGRFTPVPYVTLPLLTEDGTSAIKEVVVGPTPHRDLAIMAVAALLRQEDVIAPVSASQTTFREW